MKQPPSPTITQEQAIALAQLLATFEALAKATRAPEDKALPIIYSALCLASASGDPQAVSLTHSIGEPSALLGRAYARYENRPVLIPTLHTLISDTFATAYAITTLADPAKRDQLLPSGYTPAEFYHYHQALLDQIDALLLLLNHHLHNGDDCDLFCALSTHLTDLRLYIADLTYLAQCQDLAGQGQPISSADRARHQRLYTNLPNHRTACTQSGDHLTILCRNA